MKSEPIGPHFWHCYHTHGGIPLLTFGETEQAARQRMMDYIATLTDSLDDYHDEYDGLLDAWYGHARQPGRNRAYYEGYCCGFETGVLLDAPSH